MSSESPQSRAAGQQATTAAGLAQTLGGLALPEIQTALGRIRSELGAGFNEEPGMIKNAFAGARQQLGTAYDMATHNNQFSAQYEGIRQGGMLSDAQNKDLLSGIQVNMDARRAQAQAQLDFQEAQASLGTWTGLMNLMGGGANQALNLGAGWSGQAGTAIGRMNNQDPASGAVGGALSGAATGASVGGGWGALIGGAVGGVGGYFGSGG